MTKIGSCLSPHAGVTLLNNRIIIFDNLQYHSREVIMVQFGMKLITFFIFMVAGLSHAFSNVRCIGRAKSGLFSSAETIENENAFSSRRGVLASISTLVAVATSVQSADARLEAVNRPDLLPKETGLNVIQTEKFLTAGQARRMNDLLTALERDTGVRLRVLCQNYPNTPGLAIRDYWDLGKEDQKDDKYIVLVVDQFGGMGNVLNFNVGDGVKFALPNVFWTRLSGKYGTVSNSKFYVNEALSL